VRPTQHLIVYYFLGATMAGGLVGRPQRPFWHDQPFYGQCEPIHTCDSSSVLCLRATHSSTDCALQISKIAGGGNSRSEEADPVTKPCSPARQVVPEQTSNMIGGQTHFSSEGTSCIRCPRNGCRFQLRHLTEISKSASWTMTDWSTRSCSPVTKMEPNGSML
jgi:hypothetical protein